MTWPFLLVLALALVLRALVVLRPLEALDGLTMPDDCYYTLNLARSIARGLGPYTGLAHTNGFQPLFGFLLVPAFWIFSDPLSPVRAALSLSAGMDVAALAVFGLILLRQVSDRRVVWGTMFMWAVSPYSISNATNGLETSLALCLALAAVSYFPRLARRDSGAREFFVFGLLGGLAMFARVDAGLLLVSAGIVSIPQVFSRGPAAAIRLGVSTGVAAVLANVPWWLFSFHYTGRVYPDSGRAVRLISFPDVAHPTFATVYRPALLEGVHTVLGHQRGVLVVLMLAVLWLLARGGIAALRLCAGDVWRKQAVLILFSCGLFLAYTLYIFGQWFFFRYFYVTSVSVLFVTGITLDHALRRSGEGRERALLGVFALIFVAVIGLRPPPKVRLLTGSGPTTFEEIYFTSDAPHRAWMNIGVWARDHFAAGTVVACRTSGAIGYFADNLTVVNLDGVVNPDAYDAMVAHRLLEYAQDVKVEEILVWGNMVAALREWSPAFPVTALTLEQALDFQSLGLGWSVYHLAAR